MILEMRKFLLRSSERCRLSTIPAKNKCNADRGTNMVADYKSKIVVKIQSAYLSVENAVFLI